MNEEWMHDLKEIAQLIKLLTMAFDRLHKDVKKTKGVQDGLDSNQRDDTKIIGS